MDDEPVHIFRPDQYGGTDQGLWIPESVFENVRRVDVISVRA